jgi:periplasmic protein TonB
MAQAPFKPADMHVPAPSPAAFTARSADAGGLNLRVIGAIVAVVALHVALLIFSLTQRDTPPRPVEARTITAELISALPQPVAAPAVIQSTPTPPPPKPVPPKPMPRPRVQSHVKPALAPSPMPVQTDAPSTLAAAAPEPAPAPPSPPPAAAAAAPAIGRPTLALGAPKDVSHLDCNIAAPEYPALSRRRNETGTAVVRFVVGLTGRIENIELKKTSGSSRLDDAALDAMRASACKPYKENGEPVRAAYSQPFVFSLDD